MENRVPKKMMKKLSLSKLKMLKGGEVGAVATAFRSSWGISVTSGGFGGISARFAVRRY